MGKSLSIRADYDLKETLYEVYLREKDQVDFRIPKKTKSGKYVRG